MTATLDEQITRAFSLWGDSDREFGRTRAIYDAACVRGDSTESSDAVELRERLLQLEKTCAANFAELARLSEVRLRESSQMEALRQREALRLS